MCFLLLDGPIKPGHDKREVVGCADFCPSCQLLKEPLDILEITGVVFVAAGVWFTHPTAVDERSAKAPMTGTTIGIVLVIIAAVLEGLGQVLLKKSTLAKVRWFFWISAGVTVLALEALVYTEALKFLDVSVAFTIMSLNLIAITVLSHFILREHVTKSRWIGVGLIFVGVALVMARA